MPGASIASQVSLRWFTAAFLLVGALLGARQHAATARARAHAEALDRLRIEARCEARKAQLRADEIEAEIAKLRDDNRPRDFGKPVHVSQACLDNPLARDCM